MSAMEFGGCLLNVTKPSSKQERAWAKRKGSYHTKNRKEFSQTPIYIFVLPSDLQFEISKMIVPFHQGTFEDDVPFPKIGWSPGPGYSKMSRKIRAMWIPP